MIKMMYKHKMASQITEACYMYLLTKQDKVHSTQRRPYCLTVSLRPVQTDHTVDSD